VRLQALEDRLGVILREPLRHRAVHHQPRRRGCGPERPVHEGLRTAPSQNQWSNTPKSRANAVEHRELLRGVARHDVGVLVVGGLATDLAGEVRDVVGTKPSIVGVAPEGGAFQGALAASPILNRLWSSSVLKQLRVGVEVLLTRVRVRRVHVGSDRVRNYLAFGTVLRPTQEWDCSGPCR